MAKQCPHDVYVYKHGTALYALRVIESDIGWIGGGGGGGGGSLQRDETACFSNSMRNATRLRPIATRITRKREASDIEAIVLEFGASVQQKELENGVSPHCNASLQTLSHSTLQCANAWPFRFPRLSSLDGFLHILLKEIAHSGSYLYSYA